MEGREGPDDRLVRYLEGAGHASAPKRDPFGQRLIQPDGTDGDPAGVADLEPIGERLAYVGLAWAALHQEQARFAYRKAPACLAAMATDGRCVHDDLMAACEPDLRFQLERSHLARQERVREVCGDLLPFGMDESFREFAAQVDARYG